MDNRQVKEEFISKLTSRPNIWYRKVSDIQYVTRCCFCGDSSDPSHGHLYIKVNKEDNSPIVYNCFKCPANGVVTKDVCERLEIYDINTLSGIDTLNSTCDKYDKKQIMGEKFINFDFKLPNPVYGPKVQYIENRLGKRFTEEDCKNMKMITSFYQFLTENNIKELTCSPTVARMLELNYVGFLSYGNSHILFRDITEKSDISWIKYPITRKSSENRIFYSLSSQINPFTEGLITINLCEGVLDAVSVYHNLGYNTENTITIAVTGKYYEPIVRFLIGLGLFGSNVQLNIFADNDAMFNPKNKMKDTNIEFYRKIFSNFKYIYKSIKVFYNIKNKDCGYPKDQIILKEYKL